MPQDHSGHTGVLRDIVKQIQNTESLRTVVVAQRGASQDTKGWECLPLTSQCAILASMPLYSLNIPLDLPHSIHHFLNTHNTTALQARCALTYSGHNLYLPTSFSQALLQGHILYIPNPDSPTVLNPV